MRRSDDSELVTAIEEVMGIPVIMQASGPRFDAGAIARAFDWLRAVDEKFSTYRYDSEISRLNRAEMPLYEADQSVLSVLMQCEALRKETFGYFDIAAPTQPTGGVDPSGFVKGWALEGAARMLRGAGAESYCVNAGGDIRLSGAPPGNDAWRVGVQHPRRRDALAAVLRLRDGAVATSGEYERGQHIIDPHTGRPPEGLLSVTIVGSNLALADAYATTAFAMGRPGASWAASLPRHGAIVIFDDDTISYSATVERHLLDARIDAAVGPGEGGLCAHHSSEERGSR